MMEPQWQEARQILAVRLDNLGDVLVTTPAIHAIKETLPAAEITLLASPVGAQVGRLNPDLTDVIVYEAPWVDPWCRLPHDSSRERATIDAMRERRFDAAVIFSSFRQSPLPAAYLCYLADIPLRLAASIDGPGSLLTTRHRHLDRPMHEVERGLDLVSAVGFATDEVDLVLHVPSTAARRIARWLAKVSKPQLGKLSGPVVVVHPGSSMPARRYPPEQFAEIVTLLVGCIDATVIITGGAEERELVAAVADRLPAAIRESVFPMAGEFTFPDFCGLIQAADLVVTNNTGPMHMAAAVKTPVVALFALTNPPEQWGPWRVPHRLLYHEVACRICYSRVCPCDQECLRLVSPERAIEAAVELLSDRDHSVARSPSAATRLPLFASAVERA